jgi:hypothetical protein
MTRICRRPRIILLATALMLSLLVPLGHVTAAGAAAPASKRDRIRVLTAALKKMRKDYQQLIFSPGAPDILDYQIGDL